MTSLLAGGNLCKFWQNTRVLCLHVQVMASQLSNIPKEQSCSINCEICRKFISEPTDRYAICGKTKNFTEDLQQFNVPLSKDGYLCKSCVRKLQKHRRIKENLEKSAEEIKSLLRSSLKRGPNVVDEGSSIYFPVIKKRHVRNRTRTHRPLHRFLALRQR